MVSLWRWVLPVSRTLLENYFGTGAEPIIARAPGRVNLIGEHTDYNGGYVLPFAIDRCTTVFLRPRRDYTVRACATAFDETVEFKLPLRNPKRTREWPDYLTGILLELSRRKKLTFGFDGVITSDVPIGAGLSSSAALEIALSVGLCRVYQIQIEDLELVRLCQRVENEYVGTHCGIMDQLVSLLAADRLALLLDTDSLRFRNVPLPLEDTSFLVVDTNVHRLLSHSGYNDRRRECEAALALLKEAFPDRKIRTLTSVERNGDTSWEGILPPVLQRRVAHVLSENARVLRATAALENDDIQTLGELVFASHASLRDLFEVSTPELDFLVDWAGRNGAIGARLVGGGFGGATLHLVSPEHVPDYADRIRYAYKERFEKEPSVLTVHPGPGGKSMNA